MSALAVFWRTFARTSAAIAAVGSGGLAAAGQWQSSASFGAGVVISCIAVALLGLTAASYVESGLRASRGGVSVGGKFLRAGLLAARLILVAVALALSLRWPALNLPAFAAGLGMAPVAVAAAGLRAGRQDL